MIAAADDADGVVHFLFYRTTPTFVPKLVKKHPECTQNTI